MQIPLTNRKSPYIAGFTLVELAVVLVIIGLIVGGVMVGRDLIETAATRSQIAQLESYITAAHTFQNKYGQLPGDIRNATRFGFESCGNGDGIIIGPSHNREAQDGEMRLFWQHLSQARLIPETLNTLACGTNYPAGVTVANYYPPSKLRNNTRVYLWGNGRPEYYGKHYLTVNAVSAAQGIGGVYGPGNTMGWNKVIIAYNIDTKLDDGLPQSGKLTTMFPTDPAVRWSGTYNHTNSTNTINGYTHAVSGSTTTCQDNNNTAGQPQKYSTQVNGGNEINCAITLQW